ncbi:insulinase family protein [Xanthomonas cerealis pv. cerealis]|uniref:Insulinase family protein n=1 Tax=Xanthomonas cerealis pv. cerealis TaxID=152263 RepID=A0A514EG78_9XANT|nr:pitrilysin family protein [Xanthomonas translucens]QDI05020.1 insulinase family protein [Xanthomonas translucens pv. cerealis]
MTVSIRPRGALLAIALSTALGALSYAPPSSAARPPAAATVDIAYEQFTLPNGLRVVVHTDRKAPIVAVNLWYHVGAKDEPAGRTGFAHLFEHLMFQGSENHSGEFFEPFKQVGATDQNGTTNSDRTNYFENVPTTALDMALWMESDRMGHLVGAIDQAALDEQRGVVQNEKRQGENQPYGQAWDRLSRALYPKGHPYHHSVIGSMNDLNAASLADVKQWFRTWYGPNNAVLVLAGDIDVATAKEKVARYFGDIPAGPSMAQPQVDVAQRTQSTRETMTDKVPQARIYRVWNVAQTGTEDIDRLQLLAQLLGGAKSSRLDRRLVHEDKLVDQISAGAWPSQLGSSFGIIATVKQGVDPAKVEAVIDEELRKLLDNGPDKDELLRAKTAFRAGFVRGIERIGGFGGKADALAECTVFTGDPGCFRTSLATIESTRARDLKAVGRKWLGKGDHTLVVQPGERVALAEDPAVQPAPLNAPPVDPKYRALPSVVDRSAGPPKTTQFPQLKFPALQRATLKNGTQLILAERHDVPVVQFSYEFHGGFSADQGRKSGTANFTMGMLDEGAGERDALGFADAADSLGAALSAGASLDGSNAYLSALKENLAPSLALYADLLRRPRFEQKEIERIKASWIAGIRQEKAQPNAVAMRVLPPLLYGAGHPYAIPFSGSGTEAEIAALERADLVDFQRDWIRPEQATLIVVGDTTLAEVVPLLNAQFGDWKGEGAAPALRAPAAVPRPSKPRVYLIDQPGAVQANLFAAELVPPTTEASSIRFDIANGVLGGDFTSRLNMNLRESKHWSYGARSSASNALGQRPWSAAAPVQIDKTAPALQEMQKEINAFASGKAPPTAEEVARIRNIQTLSLPGAYETASSVLGAIGGIVRYGRPDDYVFTRKAEIEAMTPAQVREAAATLDANALTWVVVGDLKQIERPVRALKLGEVTVIDADGKPQGAAPVAPKR